MSTGFIKPFKPQALTVTLNATTSSSSAAVPAYSEQIRVHNAGTAVAFMRWGVGATNAVLTDMPIAAGGTEIFTKDAADTVAVITLAGTATVYVTPGAGE